MTVSTSLGGALLAIAGLLVCTSGSAQADAEADSAVLARRVYLADDPAAALAALTPAEVELVRGRTSIWTAVEFAGAAAQRPPTVHETAGMSSAPGVGCWSQYRYYKWYDLGINIGDTWMTAHLVLRRHHDHVALPQQPRRPGLPRREVRRPRQHLRARRRVGGAAGAGLQVRVPVGQRHPVHADPGQSHRSRRVRGELRHELSSPDPGVAPRPGEGRRPTGGHRGSAVAGGSSPPRRRCRQEPLTLSGASGAGHQRTSTNRPAPRR